MVSFKGYIYMTQSYFCNLYRFKPGGGGALEEISCFTHPPAAVCSLGSRLVAFTCSGNGPTDVTAVEEYRDTNEHEAKIIFTGGTEMVANGVAGSCAVVMVTPPVNPGVSAYHKRYVNMYG